MARRSLRPADLTPISWWAGSRSAWDPAEPDLVSVGINVGDLAHAIRVRLPLRRLQSPLSYLGHLAVDVINDDGVHGVAGVFWPLNDVHRPVLGEFPHRLCVVGEERWRGAEQPLVPGQRRGIVVDRYPCEQVDGHAARLVEATRDLLMRVAGSGRTGTVILRPGATLVTFVGFVRSLCGRSMQYASRMGW